MSDYTTLYAANSNLPPILFYRTNDVYDIFSNVTDIPGKLRIWIEGTRYEARSSEAIYQGFKGINSQNSQDKNTAINLIQDNQPAGAHLQKTGNALKNKLFMDTQLVTGALSNELNSPADMTVKEALMYEILLCKATQNVAILAALFATGDREIVENTFLASYDDSFWGNGKQQQGRNALGTTWMRLRKALRTELQNTGKIRVRTGISNALAADFGLKQHPSDAQFAKNSQGQDLVWTKQQIDKAPQHLNLANQVTGYQWNGQEQHLVSAVGATASMTVNHNLGVTTAPQTSAIEGVKAYVGASRVSIENDSVKLFYSKNGNTGYDYCQFFFPDLAIQNQGNEFFVVLNKSRWEALLAEAKQQSQATANPAVVHGFNAQQTTTVLNNNNSSPKAIITTKCPWIEDISVEGGDLLKLIGSNSGGTFIDYVGMCLDNVPIHYEGNRPYVLVPKDQAQRFFQNQGIATGNTPDAMWQGLLQEIMKNKQTLGKKS